jgi:hypothetical protein
MREFEEFVFFLSYVYSCQIIFFCKSDRIYLPVYPLFLRSVMETRVKDPDGDVIIIQFRSFT